MSGHKSWFIWILVILAGCLARGLPVFAQETDAGSPIVHAVLFFSPACPHCHQAINDVMIPLMEQYGEQLAVLNIDVTTEAGSDLFAKAAEYYETPENRRAVPTLIIEDTVLVSTMEIKNEFPGMIEAALAAGGNRWPDFPGLAELVAEAITAPDANQAETALPTVPPIIRPGAAVVGEVETAVCGPVDDCNGVQSTAYAQNAYGLIAVLGLLFILTVSALRLMQRISRQH